jgi:FtsP/CotA-like multicopper oxidase with cupredoxin domain
VRIYNASQDVHSMHQHGFDITVVSQNGHEVPVSARHAVTTIDEGPGNFHEFEFTLDKPGKWLFHCHFPHHTSNSMMSGPDGSPVGMARVFNVTE